MLQGNQDRGYRALFSSISMLIWYVICTPELVLRKLSVARSDVIPKRPQFHHGGNVLSDRTKGHEVYSRGLDREGTV